MKMLIGVYVERDIVNKWINDFCNFGIEFCCEFIWNVVFVGNFDIDYKVGIVYFSLDCCDDV